MAVVVLTCLRISNTAYGAVYTVPEINIPDGNGDMAVSITGGTNSLDLTAGGFAGVETGNTVERGTYQSGDKIVDLFASIYQEAYTEYKSADDAYQAAAAAYDRERSPETEAARDAAKAALELKETALVNVCNDPGNKLVISVDDVKNIFVNQSSQVLYYSEQQASYKDAISGKELHIDIKKNIVYSENDLGLPDGDIYINYDKPVADQKQHNDMHVVEVSGGSTVLNVDGNDNAVYDLHAISKNGSGVFEVKDSAELNFNTSISYKTGGNNDTGKLFDREANKQFSSNLIKGEVTWGGHLTTPFGTFDIIDAASANAYNDALIKYIQSDEEVRLLNQEQVQAYYDQWAGKMYSVSRGTDASYTYNWDENQLQEIEDAAIKAGDIGLTGTQNNYFVGIHDSNSVINVKEGVVIDATNSGGTVIKGNFADSGTGGRNTLNIDGTIKGSNSNAVNAVNMDVNISTTGKVENAIIINTGTIENKGTIANTTIKNGVLNNYNKINGYVSAEKSAVTNKGVISGNVSGSDSTLDNDDAAVIHGNVAFSGADSEILNAGTINGSVSVSKGAQVNNSSDIIGSGKTVVAVSSGSGYVGGADSNIYIGYANKDQWDDPATPKASGSNIVSGNSRPYTGINIENGSFENAGTIYLAGSQVDVVGIRITGDADYKDYQSAEIILNNENDLGGLDRTNNNTAILVENITDYQNNPLEINSKITLNDVGGTGIEVRNYADVTLNNDINLNSVGDGVTYGAFVDGSYSKEGAVDKGAPKFTLVDSNININADKGIGLHIRNGGMAAIEGDSTIQFAADKNKQIGVLLSGNVSESNLEYKSTEQLLVKGNESVLFRIERGATFDVDKLLSETPNITLDSNNSNNSSLFVVTGGAALGSLGASQLNINEARLLISGENSMGIRVEGGAVANIGKNTAIELSGKNNVVARIDGYYYDLDGSHNNKYNGNSQLTSSLELSNSNFSGDAEDSVGYHALNSGRLIHEGKIDFSTNGNQLIGVLLTDGGRLESKKNSEVKVNGTAVKIIGDKAVAVINNEGGGTAPLIHATDGTADSTINVGTGTQNVKGVHMNGADFVFGNINPDDAHVTNGIRVADDNIKTEKLEVSGGRVVADVSDVKNPAAPSEALDAGKESILKHDDNNRKEQLIQANTVTQNGSITIVDKDGNALAPTSTVAVNQKGTQVANAKYGIDAYVETGEAAGSYKNGLYAVVGLTEIELLEKEENANNALRLNAFGEIDEDARTLTAKLTGDGDVVATGDQEIILKNGNNSHTGKTIVDANAALKTGSSGSLGATSELVLQANSNTDLNGQQETVGALTAAAGSVLDLNGGALTIGTVQNTGNKDSYSNGSLKGSGTLNVEDTNLYVYGANNDLSAAVNNNGTSQIFVEQGDSLGTGVISLSDTSKLIANIAGDTSFTNTFATGDATATLVKNGSGTLTFDADQAAYEAKTEMNGGKLVFDGGDVASQEIDINGGLLRANEGTQFAGVINNNAVMVALKDTRVNNDFHNTGALYVGHNIGDTVANGDKVYVDNYEGAAGSSLHFLGQLGDDNSTINNLVIENDSTGESLVYVRNSDGMGGQTSQGIKLIEVKGNSDAEFIAGDRIIAGAYTYELQRGDSLGNNMKDWFLTSRLSQEPLAYYANYLAANDVLDLRLQDRTGSKEFTEYLKDGEEEKAESLWARSVYYKKSYWDDDKFNKTSANSNYFQMGYDVAQWKKANNRFHVGVMAGYYNGSNSISGVEDTSTSGKVDLYTAGIYGTWLKNHNDKEQTYLDTWVQYIWGDNEIKNQHINEKYDVNGVAVSFEVGHSMEVSQSENKKHYIEPKAQLIWSNLEQKTFDWAVNNNNGAAVNSFKQKTDYQLISRMGIRLASKTKADPLKKKYSNSFAELNWLHYFKDYEFSVGKDQLEMGIKDKAEIKIGLEKQFNKNCSIWANGFIQVAENSYRNVGAQLGVKYTF